MYGCISIDKEGVDLLNSRYKTDKTDYHVTLHYYKDKRSRLLDIGREVDIVLREECLKDDIAAIRVDLPSDIECSNDTPHITLWALNGRKPVESQEMLKNNECISVDDATIRGRVKRVYV